MLMRNMSSPKKINKQTAVNRPMTVHNTYQKMRETRSCTTQTCTTRKNAKTSAIRYRINRQQLLWLCILLSRFIFSTHLNIMEQGKHARNGTNWIASSMDVYRAFTIHLEHPSEYDGTRKCNSKDFLLL